MKLLVALLAFFPLYSFADPIVNFTLSSQEVSELQQDVGVAIELDSPTDKIVRVAFAVSGTASFPTDHDLQEGEFVISPGQTVGFISFRVVDDGINEGNESVVLDITSAQNAVVGTNSNHQVNIGDLTLDLPVLSFDVSDTNTTEGNGVTVSASIDQLSSNTVIGHYKISGTATNGVDFFLSEGFIEIIPGTTSSSLFVPIVADGIAEGTETVVIKFRSPLANAQLGSNKKHTINISDGAAVHPLAGTWYGYGYDIENSIREVNGDDNGHLSGYVISNTGGLNDILSQTGNTYALQDISGFNASIGPSAVSPIVFNLNLPGEDRKNFMINYGGYFAEIEVWADSDTVDGAIQANEVRARIAVYQPTPVPPYALNRPVTPYNFGQIANQTYAGVTIDPDNTTSGNGFTISTNSANNTLNFGPNLTTPFTGNIESSSGIVAINDVRDAFVATGDGADADILARHASYVGPIDGTHSRSFAMVASPDGNAIVVATCHNLAICGGSMVPGDETSIFDVEKSPTTISAMTFSLLIKQ